MILIFLEIICNEVFYHPCFTFPRKQLRLRRSLTGKLKFKHLDEALGIFFNLWNSKNVRLFVYTYKKKSEAHPNKEK